MATYGPNSPTSGASSGINGGTVAWSSPSNALASDNSYATATSVGFDTSEYLVLSDFDFAMTATDNVVGIVVEFERKDTTNTTVDNAVKMLKGGSVVGDNKASATAWPTSDAYASYGGAADLWGTTWAYDDINAASFGCVISADITADTASIDHVRITIYYTASGASGLLQRTTKGAGL